MSEKQAELKQLLTSSRQKLLDVVTAMRDADWEQEVQTEGERWTALQVIRHLQDAHTGLTGQLKRMLAGERTVPRDFDVDRWNARIQRKATEASLAPQRAMDTLEQSHQDLLAVVDSLADEDWSKTGWSAFFQREIDAEAFIRQIANHEASHADEIAAAVKR